LNNLLTFSNSCLRSCFYIGISKPVLETVKTQTVFVLSLLYNRVNINTFSVYKLTFHLFSLLSLKHNSLEHFIFTTFFVIFSDQYFSLLCHCIMCICAICHTGHVVHWMSIFLYFRLVTLYTSILYKWPLRCLFFITRFKLILKGHLRNNWISGESGAICILDNCTVLDSQCDLCPFHYKHVYLLKATKGPWALRYEHKMSSLYIKYMSRRYKDIYGKSEKTIYFV